MPPPSGPKSPKSRCDKEMEDAAGVRRRLLVATLLTSGINEPMPPAIGKEPEAEYICMLPAFCRYAQAFQTFVERNATLQVDIGVLTYTRWNVSRECPGAKAVHADDNFTQAVQNIYREHNPKYSGNCHLCQAKTASILVLKWVLVNLVAYDLVLFLDLDIDVDNMLTTFHMTLLQNGILDFAKSNAAIAADSDWAVPINTGVMLLRPNASIYREGMALLRTGVFNTNNGLGHLGPPSSVKTNSSEDWKLPPRFASNRLTAQDTWNFASASGDQGLFAIFFHLRSPRRYWPDTWRVSVRHFWAGAKPQYHCHRWVLALRPFTDSICNATITRWRHPQQWRHGGSGCAKKGHVIM